MKAFIGFILIGFFSSNSFASVSPKILKLFRRPPCHSQTCEPKSCIQTACRITNDCGSDQTIEDLTRVCRDVDGYCVEVLCNSGHCSLKSDVINVIESCQGANSECVRNGCFYGHCDFEREVEAITYACRDIYDEDCLTTLCTQKGDCEFLDRFIKYTGLCSGSK